MADAREQEAPAAPEAESPGDFLVTLGKVLREKEGIDADLADILAKHVLTDTPSADAVAKAKDAIIKLAAERAAPPAPEVDNG